MGRSFTPKYKLEIKTPGIFVSPMGWTVKENGQPTPENLDKYMEKYLASLQPGGTNAHLAEHYGLEAVSPTYARLCRNCHNGREMADWYPKTKTVNGIKLYHTFDQHGQHTYVTIPEE